MVYKGFSPVALLDSYTAERLPVISEMLNITTGVLNKMREAPTIEGAMKRETRMNMLGVNYRTSPIVGDEFTQTELMDAYGVLEEGVLVAGDRAPDATGLVVATSGAETKLFDVFNATCHTVLAFTPDVSTATNIPIVLGRYPMDVIRLVVVLPQGSKGTAAAQAEVVIDHSGHAYRAYLAVGVEQKVVVVRPDGVAGAIVRGVEGVKAYFDKIFV